MSIRSADMGSAAEYTDPIIQLSCLFVLQYVSCNYSIISEFPDSDSVKWADD